jgi:hypothetical protein
MQPMLSLESGTPASHHRAGAPEAKPHHRAADTIDPVIESFDQHAGGCRLLIVQELGEKIGLAAVPPRESVAV